MAKPKNIHRRVFVKWSIPLVVGLPLATASMGCNDTKTKDKKTSKTKSSEKNKPKRNTTEVLFYNPKTKVLHYPGIREKEKLQTEGLQEVRITEWERMIDSGEAHFQKEQSGLAFEKLALRHFQGNPSQEAVAKSMSISSRIFGKDYAQHNKFNWREYDLLLQWIALNDAVSDKWGHFAGAILQAQVDAVRKIPKRMEWVRSQQLFDKRIAYINERKTDYMARLKSRLI